jgi:large subunit ribosomal protein L9
MQIILLHDVDAVGEQGNVVGVADGFARNYLFPRKLAVIASAGALKDLEGRKVQIQLKAEKRHQENEKKAAQLEAIGTLTLEARAGEEGKLFGTITPKELAAIVQEKAGFEIDRKAVTLSNPINRVGQYEMVIRLSTRVKATLTVEVEAQGAKERLAAEQARAAAEQHQLSQSEDLAYDGYVTDDDYAPAS